jgi:hypothetical protein
MPNDFNAYDRVALLRHVEALRKENERLRNALSAYQDQLRDEQNEGLPSHLRERLAGLERDSRVLEHFRWLLKNWSSEEVMAIIAQSGPIPTCMKMLAEAERRAAEKEESA